MSEEGGIHDRAAFALMTPLVRLQRLHEFFVPDAVLGLLQMLGEERLASLVRPESTAAVEDLAQRLTDGQTSLHQGRDEILGRMPLGALVYVDQALRSLCRSKEDLQDLLVGEDDPAALFQLVLLSFASAQSHPPGGGAAPV